MKRKIIITGAGGYLGHELINLLLQTDNIVIASTSSPEKLYEEFNFHTNLKCISREALLVEDANWQGVYALIHLAFARRFRPNCEIADSLVYTKKVFEQSAAFSVPRIVNVSSQSVYGNAEEIRTEQTNISPEMIYAMAKYSSELILDTIYKRNSDCKVTNIRLDSIAQNQNLLPRLIEQAFEKNELTLMGGKQIFSLIDIRDAASAFVAILDTPVIIWKKAYNVGWNNTIYTLEQIAKIVALKAEEHGSGNVKINLNRDETKTYAGMSSEVFSADTGWKPKYDISDIIERGITEYLGHKEKVK